MNQKKILVLGGGVGGLVAADRLRRLLPAEHTITIVEKNPQHAFAPSFLWAMVGDRRPEQITRNLRDLLPPGVELLQAEAREIRLATKQVIHDKGELSYDFLIVALGAGLAPDAIPGLSEAAHTFYTLEGSLALHGALESFSGGMIALVVAGTPYKCPGAPHEAAMLLANFFRKRGTTRKVDIQIFTPEPQPMPVAGPELGQAVKEMLASKGVSFHPQHKLVRVDAQKHELHFDGKAPVQYDLLAAVPPHRPSPVVSKSGLANEAGWIPVDRSTLMTKAPNVYAIGDITTVSIPGRWKPDTPLMLPKAGVFAHAQAFVVAHRIAAEIRGQAPQDKFCGDGFCMLEAGEDLAGFAHGDFFAEPSPQVHLQQIGRAWHLGKVLFEKWWLTPPGIRREALRLALQWGARTKGIRVVL
ncbi:MAG: NAD(P)/FAD-dependent oxidoreductase [Elusimicrobia bacterium]|nr:NAD(P)/FAD-dependent oxidoreductase [Elusimicrobiota bacterium]